MKPLLCRLGRHTWTDWVGRYVYSDVTGPHAYHSRHCARCLFHQSWSTRITHGAYISKSMEIPPAT